MYLFLAVIISFLITFILLPIIIKISRSIDLLDAPDRRKIHRVSTPSLGGVGIFIGFLIAIFVTISFAELALMKYFLAGILMIFILGVRDDISSLQAKHKLTIQVLSAVLVVYFAEIRLEGLYGIFGITQLPSGVAEMITVFMIVVLTNSFNLLDGIDGLAGSVSVLILSFFGWAFMDAGLISISIVCFSVAGALVAFLFYNWFPSRVFMGDTGSMLLGFMISTLTVQFINEARGLELIPNVLINSPVGLAFAVLILPIYDTLRVFIIRFSRGKSPLAPDRNHIHHGLLKLGLNHSKASGILLSVNALILISAFVFNQYLTTVALIVGGLLTATLFGGVVDYLGRKRKYLGASAKVKGDNGLYVSKSA